MKKKRILSLLLSMIVCIAMMPVAVFATGEGSTAVTPAAEPAGVWSDYAATDFAGGTGTVDDPYKIATAEQLAKLAADINSGIGEKEYTQRRVFYTHR